MTTISNLNNISTVDISRDIKVPVDNTVENTKSINKADTLKNKDNVVVGFKRGYIPPIYSNSSFDLNALAIFSGAMGGGAAVIPTLFRKGSMFGAGISAAKMYGLGFGTGMACGIAISFVNKELDPKKTALVVGATTATVGTILGSTVLPKSFMQISAVTLGASAGTYFAISSANASSESENDRRERLALSKNNRINNN